MTKCVVYARVSSKEQESEGFSIPAQLERAKEYARTHGFEIIGEYTEAETAGKSGRSQFNKMIAAIKKPTGPKVVLVEKTDRLTRNFKDMVLVEDIVQEHNVEFHLFKQNRIIGKNASTQDRLVQGIEVVIANNFLNNLRDETKKGIRQKVRAGGWCWQAPFGYKMTEGRLVINPETALFVQKAFQFYAEGNDSLETLTVRLHKAGYIYKPYRPRVPRTHLHSILRNRIYIGEIEFEGEVYPGIHEPILDRDTWGIVQKRLNGKTYGQTEQQFLYHNALTCGACGSVLSGELKQKGKYTYYRCWKSANAKCSEKYINERIIDEAVATVLSLIEIPEDYQKKMRLVMKETDFARQCTENEEMDRIKRERDRNNDKLQKAYEDRLEGIISTEQWLQLQKTYQERNAVLQDKIGKLTNATVSYYDLALQYFELPKMIRMTWVSASPSIKGALIKMLTSNIFIKDKKVTVELVSPFSYLYDPSQNERKYPTADKLRSVLLLHSETITALHKSLSA